MTGTGRRNEPDPPGSGPAQRSGELTSRRAVVAHTVRMSLVVVAAAVSLDVVTNLDALAPRIMQSAAKTALIAGLITPIVIYRIGTYNHRLYEANAKLAQAGRIDPQTGLLNRATFIREARAALEGASMLLVLDIDHFKAINDHHGHPAGDEVIARIGEVIAATIPSPHFAGRLGGEEFGILLVGGTRLRPAAKLRDLRGKIAALRFDNIDPDLRVTVSIGAAAPSAGASFDGLYAQADARLYEAKRKGRDRVEGVLLVA